MITLKTLKTLKTYYKKCNDLYIFVTRNLNRPERMRLYIIHYIDIYISLKSKSSYRGHCYRRRHERITIIIICPLYSK